jgi:hypothetical protein
MAAIASERSEGEDRDMFVMAVIMPALSERALSEM